MVVKVYSSYEMADNVVNVNVGFIIGLFKITDVEANVKVSNSI